MTATSWQRRLPFDYAWLVLLTVSLTVFASIGLGRFTLGMILPSMGADLALSYAEMGWISTANFSGYFVAVLATGSLSRRFRIRSLILAGLSLVAGSIAVLALAQGFVSALLLYSLTGIGSGVANMMAMGLLSHWFAARHRGKAAGFAVAGNGMAILLAGAVIPWVNLSFGGDGWRLNWLLVAAVCLLVALFGFWLQRDRPSDLGLTMHGQAAGGGPGPGPAQEQASRSVLIHLGLIYFGFGFTYVIYATFIVTKLVQEDGLSESVAGQFWSSVGLLSLLSTPVFGALSDRCGRRLTLVLVLALQTLAYLLAAAVGSGTALYVSVALFGLTAWAVPGIMAASAGDYLGPARAAAGLAFLTLFFGVGQISGPALAGWLAELSGQFTAAFVLAAVVAGLATLLALPLRSPH